MSDALRVAAVCGPQVRIYGAMRGDSRRALIEVLDFLNYGQALQYAVEYDEKQKAGQAQGPRPVNALA